MSMDEIVNSDEIISMEEIKMDKFGNTKDKSEIEEVEDKVSKHHITNLISGVRYYKNKMPDINDFVIGEVKKFDELGLIIYLPEYRKEGFLNYKDASHAKKIKNIERELLVGKEYIFQIESIDHEKEYINLNRLNVRREEQVEEMSIILKYRSILNIFINCYITDRLKEGISVNEIEREDIEKFLKRTLYNVERETILKYIVLWYENEEKYNKYMNKMFSEEEEEMKENIKNVIEEHYMIPRFDVIGKLMMTYRGIDAVNKLKKIINILNIEFGVDECYIEVPPNYELVWKDQVDIEMFKEFTVEKIREIIKKNEERDELYEINFTINQKS